MKKREYMTDEQVDTEGWQRTSRNLSRLTCHELGFLIKIGRAERGTRAINGSSMHITDARKIVRETSEGVFYREMWPSEIDLLRDMHKRELYSNR